MMTVREINWDKVVLDGNINKIAGINLHESYICTALQYPWNTD